MLKIDLAKAFDRLEWNFIVQALTRKGLHGHFINLIYACVSSPTFSVVINGQAFAKFKGDRGIRQGCPLSPYLFVLAINELSIAMQEAMAANDFAGIKLGPNCPPIHSLLFADDLLVCGQATEQEATKMKQVLQEFCNRSGQTPNWMKSGILFSIRKDANSRSLCLRAWKDICIPKKEGGLGIRNLQAINQGLILMAAWRLANQPHNFLHQVLKSKYFPNSSLWRPNSNAPKSAFWASILKILPILKAHTFYQLTLGQISIWSTPWCEGWDQIYDSLIIQPENYSYPSQVKDLWIPGQKMWNEQLINILFQEQMAQRIRNTPIINAEEEDCLCWKLTPTGKCNSKSAYRVCLENLFENGEPRPRQVSTNTKLILQSIWKNNNLIPRIKTFGWRILSKAISSGARAGKYSKHINKYCCRCNLEETDQHLFFLCNYARAAWFMHPWYLKIDQVQYMTNAIKQNLELLDPLQVGVQEPQTRTGTQQDLTNQGSTISSDLRIQGSKIFSDATWRKINTPGAQGNPKTGLGVYCQFTRECREETVMIQASTIQPSSPILAEAAALLLASNIAAKIQEQGVTFLTDNLTLARAAAAHSIADKQCLPAQHHRVEKAPPVAEEGQASPVTEDEQSILPTYHHDGSSYSGWSSSDN
nr:uncharacterized protein LOC127346950 [Lolium perenne]